jgi:hypothetical protein
LIRTLNNGLWFSSSESIRSKKVLVGYLPVASGQPFFVYDSNDREDSRTFGVCIASDNAFGILQRKYLEKTVSAISQQRKALVV